MRLVADFLEIKDLTVSFGSGNTRVTAVDGLSYTIKSGEVVGVVGESGSGKSAHVLAIMGLLPKGTGQIEAGSVLFDGQEIAGLPAVELRKIRGRRIAMVFQDPISSLNPVYRVGFQLKETLRRHLGLTGKAAQERAVELLALVGIPGAAERLESYPHELSGGMRQRVMIAIALSCNPDLLIADEPTTALDVTIQAQIVELVKQLQRELNLTVIWISHDLGVVAGIAQSVNVMYAGRLVERGPVKTIYNSPKHPYNKGLLSSVPRLDQQVDRLTTIPGQPPDLTNLPKGCAFAPRCQFADQKCQTEMPPLMPSDLPDSFVRCWHWQNI